MKSVTQAFALAVSLATLSVSSLAIGDTGGLESLRGFKALEDTNPAPDMAQYAKDGMPVARNYVQQPPVVPHQIRGYQVDLRTNKCMSCHSWDNYKAANATKVSLTHFETRDGHALAEISPRRYFCLQCHVPQAVTQPLVNNGYKSTRDLKQ